MNLIKQLFSRHPHTETPAPTLIAWPGHSGKQYHYTIYSLDTAFRPLPGNYIYARQEEDGRWIPIYIAQTRDLHQRLEGHVRLSDAVLQGATAVHAHYDTTSQAARCDEERDLVLLWRPVCNDAIED